MTDKGKIKGTDGLSFQKDVPPGSPPSTRTIKDPFGSTTYAVGEPPAKPVFGKTTPGVGVFGGGNAERVWGAIKDGESLEEATQDTKGLNFTP